jgi:regulator of sigma E protease
VTAVSNVLAAIVALGAMIFFHELGHFLVARRAGVLIHAFAIGFGPKLVSWRRGATTYALNLLPFGGYVRMEGEDDGQAGGPDSFRSKSVGWRMAIIAAGALMNLALAVLILAVAAATGGIPTAPSTRIGTLEAQWPAAEAGLRPGDVIEAIDGVVMTGGDQVIETIHRSAGKALTLTVRRGDQVLTFTITPRLDPQRGVGRIGFSPEPQWVRLNPLAALWWGLQRTGQFILMLGGAVGALIRERQFVHSLGGPLAAGNMLAQAAATGFQTFLNIAAFISVIIGVFNLLPIPALDGGRLAFLAVEAVRRRPLDPRREGWVHMVGFALLVLLLVLLTVRDLRRLLGVGG